MLKVILPALWLATAASVLAAQEGEIPWHNVEVVIRGDLFRAAMVAYQDFAKRLAERAAGEKGVREPYLATINNYDFHVGKGPGIYVVRITPRLSQELPGVFGGGATYAIDARSFTVSETRYSK